MGVFAILRKRFKKKYKQYDAEKFILTSSVHMTMGIRLYTSDFHVLITVT